MRHLLIAAIIVANACGSFQSNDTYKNEILKWHQKRIDALKSGDSWLSLAGLYWLEAGQNQFGSDLSNTIVFPADKAAPYMGSFVLADSAVTVIVKNGVRVLNEGEPVSEMELKSDAGGDPTVLTHGSLKFYIIERSGRFGVRLKDTEHPRLKAFSGIEMFPIEKDWRVEAVLKPYDPTGTIAVPTVLGNTIQSSCPGKLQFEIDGQPYALEPIAEPDDQRWFIIFGDLTNGDETYGGGRFVYVDRPDAQGRTIIDFNKAYNPPCVFSGYATCPLPHAANKLDVAIPAGEKMWGHSDH